jgi:hypothetical protein
MNEKRLSSKELATWNKTSHAFNSKIVLALPSSVTLVGHARGGEAIAVSQTPSWQALYHVHYKQNEGQLTVGDAHSVQHGRTLLLCARDQAPLLLTPPALTEPAPS